MGRHGRAALGGVPGPGRPQGAVRRALAATAAVAGPVTVVAIAVTLAGSGRGARHEALPARPARSLPSAAAGLPSGVPRTTAAGARLVIPAIHVDAPIVPSGATGSQGVAALSIPDDIRTVGWWDGSVREGGQVMHEDAPRPGQPGVAVIAGHVDSDAGPGALYYLKDLRVGDSIEITDSSGRASAWTVDAPPQANLKTELPPALWVTTGPPTLALVTCGGPFDSATGHYLDNVIVWARSQSASIGKALILLP